MTDEIEEACLIDDDEFTEDENAILEQLNSDNIDTAILMLSTYKGKNYYLFDLAYQKLLEYDMLYQFVHLYRTRSTVGDMKSKIMIPSKELFLKALSIAIDQFNFDVQNQVKLKQFRIKVDMIQAFYSMACKLHLPKTILEMYSVFDIIPESSVSMEMVGYLQYSILPKVKTDEQKIKVEKIISIFREKMKV